MVGLRESLKTYVSVRVALIFWNTDITRDQGEVNEILPNISTCLIYTRLTQIINTMFIFQYVYQLGGKMKYLIRQVVKYMRKITLSITQCTVSANRPAEPSCPQPQGSRSSSLGQPRGSNGQPSGLRSSPQSHLKPALKDTESPGSHYRPHCSI